MKSIERLNDFVRRTDASKNWPSYISSDKKRLIKQRIIEACNLPRSSLYQNPEVKIALAQIERRLRNKGVLVSNEAMDHNAEMGDSVMLNVFAQLEMRLAGFEEAAAALSAKIEKVQADLSYIIRSR